MAGGAHCLGFGATETDAEGPETARVRFCGLRFAFDRRHAIARDRGKTLPLMRISGMGDSVAHYSVPYGDRYRGGIAVGAEPNDAPGQCFPRLRDRQFGISAARMLGENGARCVVSLDVACAVRGTAVDDFAAERTRSAHASVVASMDRVMRCDIIAQDPGLYDIASFRILAVVCGN